MSASTCAAGTADRCTAQATGRCQYTLPKAGIVIQEIGQKNLTQESKELEGIFVLKEQANSDKLFF